MVSSSSNLHVIVEAIGLSLKGTRKRKRMNNVHQRMKKRMLRQALYMEDLTGQRNMIKRKAPDFEGVRNFVTLADNEYALEYR